MGKAQKQATRSVSLAQPLVEKRGNPSLEEIATLPDALRTLHYVSYPTGRLTPDTNAMNNYRCVSPVKAEVATEKAEALTQKAEAATGCAKYRNILAEALTQKAEAATDCAIHENVLTQVAESFKETIEIFFDGFL